MTYTFVAKAEGAYLLYSTAGNVGLQLGFGGAVDAGTLRFGHGAARTAEWYRSQVTKADLDLATTGTTADGHPILDYDSVYPPSHPRAGQPILKMLDAKNEIVYSDLTAIITGPEARPIRLCELSVAGLPQPAAEPVVSRPDAAVSRVRHPLSRRLRQHAGVRGVPEAPRQATTTR